MKIVNQKQCSRLLTYPQGRLIARCGLFAALFLGLASFADAADKDHGAANLRARNIIRKKLPEADLIGLEYTVMEIDQAGNTKVILDPRTHAFKIGDSFMLKVAPQDNVYVYVFTEGPEGERACLLPQPEGLPLRVEAGQEIVLPENGDVFTFELPAGEEKLVVVATKEPSQDLGLLTRAALDREERGRLDSKMTDLRNADDLRIKTRGSPRALEEKLSKTDDVKTESLQIEAPADNEVPATEVINLNAKEIIVDIPLRSERLGR